MLEVSKNWTQFKQILMFNNLYFDYEDSEDGTRRVITCQRNASTSYVCGMDLVESPAEGSDQKDFDDNWASKAGEKKYVYYSQQFQVTASGDEFDFKIKANDEVTDVEAFVYKGMICVDAEAQRGDSLEVSVVDKDNILGYGAGLVVGYMIRKKILSGGAQEHFINPPKYDFLSSKRKIPAGLYVRVKYIGAGSGRTWPNIICDYEYEY